MKTVSEFNFNNEKVIMRVDFNVPLDNNLQIADDSRIRAALPSIKKVLNDGGSLILMSHLGRPKGGYDEKFSLKNIVNRLSELTETKVIFSEDCIGESAEKLSSELKSGEILLLENLRFHPEEKKGDESFAEKLASLATFYVNDAFGTAHRAHASTSVIAKFFPKKKCFGFLMAKEIENAKKVISSPQKPFTAIVGGAKVSDKLLIIENLMNISQNILIGGGMAYTFAKAMGGKIGNSLCEDDRIELCQKLIELSKEKGVNLVLPVDSVIADNFDANANTDYAENHSIPEGWMGLDIGEKSVEEFCNIIENSKTILWNGPMGVFEMDKFSNGTKRVAESLAKATENGAYTLIGGGDSATAINKFGFAEKVSYVSTGGGALLEFFEGKTLPGVAAIESNSASV